MARDAAGLEWALYKRRKAEAKGRTREVILRQIVWELPANLLPVRYERFRHKYGGYVTSWYTKDSYIKRSFVYVLTHGHSDIVRYVGVTDDPPRRLVEHMKNPVLKPLNGNFVMRVIDIGGEEEEREYIKKYLAEGADLLNTIHNKPS